MTDTVIERFNLLVKYQQYLLVFTDYSGQLIGDVDIDLTGVYVDGD